MTWGNIIQKVDTEKLNWWKHSAEHISRDGKIKNKMKQIKIKVDKEDDLFEIEKFCFKRSLNFEVIRYK